MLRALTRPCAQFSHQTNRLLCNTSYRHFSQDLSDESLQSMSLLQYGDKQVYLFGIDSHSEHDSNMSNMVKDLQPNHILLGLCQERGDKLWEKINSQSNSGKYSPSLHTTVSGIAWITPDDTGKVKFKWKSSSIATQIIKNCGLIYGRDYYETMIAGKQQNVRFVYGDLPIKSIIGLIEEFVGGIERENAIKESKTEKLIKESRKTQPRPTGRQKAARSIENRIQKATQKAIAKLNEGTVITLDNVSDMFMDTEFLSNTYPQLFDKLYSERDQSMFEQIKKCADGEVIFAVVPDIHVQGITQRLVDEDAIVLM